MNGKAIYMPKGKAGEYAKYACNFYVGCSNDCDYCYCKRGVLGHAMGQPVATLKKCFKDEKDALEVFRKELVANLEELKQHGLFFTFTSDPWLPETKNLTIAAVGMALSYWVPCKILTKRADFVNYIPGEWYINKNYHDRLAFGFTLTGHDELERGASTNAERIEAMRLLHDKFEFKTFASIEPIVDLKSAEKMICDTRGFCDLYKIGLMSGKRPYTQDEVRKFFNALIKYATTFDLKIYWKASVREYIGLESCDFPCCVEADYNIFAE